MIAVRLLHQTDLGQIVSCAAGALLMAAQTEKGLARDAAWAERTLRDFLARGVGPFLIAELEGGACGFLALTWHYSLSKAAPFGVVQEVYVSPAFRGRGVARALLAAAAEAARSHGACRLELLTDHENAAARRAYARAGFEELPEKLACMKFF